jgi:murein DD-endopeptidase MepM/ murein hydrolase activator NlpD
VSSKPAKTGQPAKTGGFFQAVVPMLMWGVAILMVAVAGYVAFNRVPVVFSKSPDARLSQVTLIPTLATNAPAAALPTLAATHSEALSRSGELHTDIPDRPSVEGQDYTVESGDSVFAISQYFKLKPETILWANYNLLNDNPDMLGLGQKLYIPPVDGVVHKWKDGDTLQSVASQYKANVKDILLWPGNKLDIINPVIAPGTMVMVPGGQREFRQTWVVPTIPRGAAGVALSFPGGCDTGTGGLVGTGAFIWPGPVHKLSGNDYWSGHLGVDIAIGVGTPVVAADSGVVVFSGWTTVGYGNMVMIDHGNGYQTLYAHLTAALVRCGQSVVKGVTVGTGGSTGNSTGPHLHFEIRFMGGFVNPHAYLR